MDVSAFGSWMSSPKCLLFQDFEGLTEAFVPRRPPGYPRGHPQDIRLQNLLFLKLSARPLLKIGCSVKLGRFYCNLCGFDKHKERVLVKLLLQAYSCGAIHPGHVRLPRGCNVQAAPPARQPLESLQSRPRKSGTQSSCPTWVGTNGIVLHGPPGPMK